MEWYKDHVRPGMDETNLTESFNEFAAAKHWPAEQRDADANLGRSTADRGHSGSLLKLRRPPTRRSCRIDATLRDLAQRRQAGDKEIFSTARLDE
jgi:hypothetical protein